MANALKPDELDALRAIDSPTIANAIEYFSVRPRVAGYCGANVRNLTPEAGVMLGYAVTCRGDSTTEDKDRREHTQLYRAILAEQPLPVVVVIGNDGDPNKIHLSCHAGEMMATTMKRVGAVGLLTFGTHSPPHTAAACPTPTRSKQVHLRVNLAAAGPV